MPRDTEIAKKARAYGVEELKRLRSEFSDNRDVATMISVLVSTFLLNTPKELQAEYREGFIECMDRFV